MSDHKNLDIESFDNDPFAVNNLILFLSNKYGLTQKDLVMETGIHKSQMSRFFNKREVPAKQQLEKLAKPLKVSKETLWILAGDMLPPSKESAIIDELKSLEESLRKLSKDEMKEDLGIDIKLNANERQFIQEYIEFIKYKRQKR
ncbi:MAG: helix-turn-helix transcriptional regulator [Clostridiales bacterium]|nr:helix-turn-helix transcriptional regulator [Clostridiales bacterium]